MPMHDWTRVDAGIYLDFHHEWISEIKRAEPRVAATRLLCPCRASGCRVRAGCLDVARPDGRHGLQRRGCRDSGTSQDDVLHRTPRRVPTAQEKHGGSPSRQRGSHCRHRRNRRAGKQKQCQLLRAFVQKACELMEQRIHLLLLEPFPPGRRDPNGIHSAIWEQFTDGPFGLPPEKPLTMVLTMRTSARGPTLKLSPSGAAFARHAALFSHQSCTSWCRWKSPTNRHGTPCRHAGNESSPPPTE